MITSTLAMTSGKLVYRPIMKILLVMFMLMQRKELMRAGENRFIYINR